MANRPVFNLVDKASTNVAISGPALSAELATQAFPESGNKRQSFHLFVAANGVTSGATPQELFIDGIQNFRFRIADQSTALIKVWGAYTSSVGGSDTVFELTAGVTNRAGVVALLANSTNVKMPNASTATLVLTVATPNVIITATGIAGDANGRWDARLEVVEITDIG
jgi:hypothetical protein